MLDFTYYILSDYYLVNTTGKHTVASIASTIVLVWHKNHYWEHFFPQSEPHSSEPNPSIPEMIQMILPQLEPESEPFPF
eukprot:scaffold242422_cov35-Attheya_sp.AAC.2